MTTHRLHLLLSVILVCSGFAQAQSLKSWVNAADSAFAQRDYFPAIKYYEAALKYDSSRLDLQYKFAEANFLFQAYRQSAQAFQRIAESPAKEKYPQSLLRLAQSYHFLGNYPQAKHYYLRFLQEVPSADFPFVKTARKGLSDIAFTEQKTNTNSLIANNMGAGINSPYSDFGALFHNDTLYFSSFRFVSKTDKHNPPRPYHKILQSVNGSIGQPLADYINEPGKHIAHTAFNHDHTILYYTICDYINQTDIQCHLYLRHRNGQGWGPAQKLNLNIPGYTSTEPATGKNTLNGEEWLFFVSDRPGGNGGLDIWYAAIQPDGNCANPINLSALNTPGNDVTPFFHQTDQTLFFSSDDYPGYGGLDIFRVPFNNGQWETPENIGQPFNSSAHDVYFSMNASGTKAVLSSNRSGAYFLDEDLEMCCYDIWEVPLSEPPFLPRLNLIVETATPDLKPLPGSRIELFELTPSGNTRLITSVQQDTLSRISFQVNPGKKYLLTGTKNAFYPSSDTLDLSHYALASPGDSIVKTLIFTPATVPVAIITLDAITGQPISQAQVSIIKIHPDGHSTILENPEPEWEKDYRYTIQVSSPGYSITSKEVDLRQAIGPQRIEIRMMPADKVLEVTTLRKYDKSAITGANISLYTIGTDGQQVLIDTKSNTKGHTTYFPLASGKTYGINATHPGFYQAFANVDLSNPTLSGDTIRQVLLLDLLLTVNTFDEEAKTKLTGVSIELRELSAQTTKTVVNPDNNNFLFPVMPGKTYIITADKPGYTRFTDTINIPADTLQKEVDIYLRLRDFQKFLPLALYFDNDYPDPKSNSSTTTLDYQQTFDRYYLRKQEFVQEFTRGEPLNNNDRFLIEEVFEKFFERDVRGGFRDLELFSAKLLEFLEEGNSIEIELRGYASPRGAPEYNLILSRRRANCVYNYFTRYQQGALLQYLNNGNLKIGKIGFGEQTPDPIRASDRFDDLKGSVFSQQASIARRVEIIDVKIKENNP
jgi:hypothetical protein